MFSTPKRNSRQQMNQVSQKGKRAQVHRLRRQGDEWGKGRLLVIAAVSVRSRGCKRRPHPRCKQKSPHAPVIDKEQSKRATRKPNSRLSTPGGADLPGSGRGCARPGRRSSGSQSCEGGCGEPTWRRTARVGSHRGHFAHFGHAT